MNKLKDFIYDKSDIVVALLIISIAGFIVFTRIDAILSYPETFAANSKPPTASEPAVNIGDKETTTDSGIEGDDEAGIDGEDDIEMLAIYVNYGESLQSVAEKFVSVELFSSTEEFLSVIEDAGVQTQVKTGNFIVPANATAEEIIEIITKPGL